MTRFLVTSRAAVLYTQFIIPWEAICASAAAFQSVADTGSALIGEIEKWLAEARELLTMGSAGQAAIGAINDAYIIASQAIS